MLEECQDITQQIVMQVKLCQVQYIKHGLIHCNAVQYCCSYLPLERDNFEAEHLQKGIVDVHLYTAYIQTIEFQRVSM